MQPIQLKSLIPIHETDVPTEGVELVNFLKTTCPTAWRLFKTKKLILYRGYKSSIETKLVDPSTRIRKSKDSNNLSLFFTSSDPSWEGIQKRNRSIILTNDYSTARKYGPAFYVFPFDGAMISYGTASDNYNNYERGFKKLGLSDQFDDIEELDTMLYRLSGGFPKQFPYERTMDSVYSTGTGPMRFLQKVDKLYAKLSPKQIEKLPDIGNISPRVAELAIYIKKHGGIFPFLRTIFDPKLNKIKTVPLSKATSAPPKVEMWTESKCIIVRTDLVSYK